MVYNCTRNYHLQNIHFYCKKCNFWNFAFSTPSLSHIFYLIYLIFLLCNLCIRNNMLLHGKDNWIIIHCDIKAPNWQNLRFSAILMIFTIFGHFGRGPPCATFWDSSQKLFYATIWVFGNNNWAPLGEGCSTGFRFELTTFCVFSFSTVFGGTTSNRIFSKKEVDNWNLDPIIRKLNKFATSPIGIILS